MRITTSRIAALGVPQGFEVETSRGSPGGVGLRRWGFAVGAVRPRRETGGRFMASLHFAPGEELSPWTPTATLQEGVDWIVASVAVRRTRGETP